MSRGLKITLAVVAVLIFSFVVLIAALIHKNELAQAQRQDELTPFYTVAASEVAGVPGSVIRSEPMTLKIEGASVQRVIYRTVSSDGTPRVSSGMIFIPEVPAPAGGRKVIAWAHPTLGMGDACAPSRSSTPLLDMNFAQQMINQGWVVTATDYAGVGTEGVGRYLVGPDEANDVAYSVQMAHNIPAAEAGKQWGVYGHSQGGHSALWTGELGQQILPEYELVGTAAAAPAAELVSLIDQQWNQRAQWSIGPDFVVGWKDKYPDLPLDSVMTQTGLRDYEGLASECIVEAALTARVLSERGEAMFDKNPLTVPEWKTVAQEQTPKPMAKSMPVLIAQGTGDTLVLPNTQARLYDEWCKAGSDLTMLWYDGASHMQAQTLSGTSVTQFFEARFQGRPSTNTCGLGTPVPAYQPK